MKLIQSFIPFLVLLSNFIAQANVVTVNGPGGSGTVVESSTSTITSGANIPAPTVVQRYLEGPTAPSSPTAPTAKPRGILTCPASYKRVVCGKSLSCNYGRFKCCGRVKYARRCTCNAGGFLECKVVRNRCPRRGRCGMMMVRMMMKTPKPQSLRKCPAKQGFAPNTRCAVPLKCQYGKTQCCGRTVYSTQCSCTRGGPIRCLSAQFKCSPCPTKVPKPVGIQKCPTRPPRSPNTVTCGKDLQCSYGQICCGKEVASPKHIRCSCTKGKKFACRFLRIRLPPCPANCDIKPPPATKRPTIKPATPPPPMEKCPKTAPRSPNMLCKNPLLCRYSPIVCCGRTVYTEMCSCDANESFRCLLRKFSCNACLPTPDPELPPPKLPGLTLCPDQKPESDSMLCADDLFCAFNGQNGNIVSLQTVKDIAVNVCACLPGEKMSCFDQPQIGFPESLGGVLPIVGGGETRTRTTTSSTAGSPLIDQDFLKGFPDFGLPDLPNAPLPDPLPPFPGFQLPSNIAAAGGGSTTTVQTGNGKKQTAVIGGKP